MRHNSCWNPIFRVRKWNHPYWLFRLQKCHLHMYYCDRTVVFCISLCIGSFMFAVMCDFGWSSSVTLLWAVYYAVCEKYIFELLKNCSWFVGLFCITKCLFCHSHLTVWAALSALPLYCGQCGDTVCDLLFCRKQFKFMRHKLPSVIYPEHFRDPVPTELGFVSIVDVWSFILSILKSSQWLSCSVHAPVHGSCESLVKIGFLMAFYSGMMSTNGNHCQGPLSVPTSLISIELLLLVVYTNILENQLDSMHPTGIFSPGLYITCRSYDCSFKLHGLKPHQSVQ